MPLALLSTTQPAGETVSLVTNNQGPLIVTLAPIPFSPLAFTVDDDDGTVGANATKSHLVALVGLRVATDKVIGVSVPPTPLASGITVTAQVNADDQLEIVYTNGTNAGATNGLTTYAIFIARTIP